jgi:hypothetical protein
MTGLIVFLIVVALILASALRGRDSRVVDDERGWWPAYRRDENA